MSIRSRSRRLAILDTSAVLAAFALLVALAVLALIPAGRRTTIEELVQRAPNASLELGEQVWESRCLGCHAGDSSGGPVLNDTITDLLEAESRQSVLRYVVESIVDPDRVVRDEYFISMRVGPIRDAEISSVARYVMDVLVGDV